MLPNKSKEAFGNSVWVFLLLTFILTWLFWIPLAVSGREATLAVIAIGAFSPSVFGVLMTYKSGGKEARAEFWRRAIGLRRIGLVWYVVIMLLFPTIMALTLQIESLLGGELPSLQPAREILTNPVALLGFLITMLIGGPLAEELGWRGFALDRLQAKWSALNASLFLGAIHAAWHLPLFFIVGTSQESMGFATNLFWLWTIQVVTSSIFYTWIYNNNQRSIFSAVLIHFMSNSTGTMIAQLGGVLPLRIEIIRTAITAAFAVIVVMVWGGGTMTKQAGGQLASREH